LKMFILLVISKGWHVIELICRILPNTWFMLQFATYCHGLAWFYCFYRIH